MEMALKMGSFEELDEQEQFEVDGGGLWAAIAGAAVKTATAVGGLCGLGPVGGAVVIGCCVVAVGVAIYAGCNS